MKFTFFIVLAHFCLVQLYAQMGIGTNQPDNNAVLDLTASNKGLLLPRIALTSTTSFAPLTGHVAGMTVYNTATQNDVIPGYYFNNGTKWGYLNAGEDGKSKWTNSEGIISLSTLSNGTTARTATSQLSIADDGSVGIGTIDPASKLEVNGAATNKAAFNAGSSNSIDFANSNIAYTSTVSTNITLFNLKNGGAYTLIFTSTSATGPVVFTATGLSFVNIGTVSRTNGKKHVYNLIVAGTVGYVTMGTEN